MGEKLRYMPLLWLSTVFLAGVVLGSQVNLSWLLWAGVGGLGVLSGLLENRLIWFSPLRFHWGRFCPLPLGFLLAVLCLGACRYQASRSEPNEHDLAFYNLTQNVQVLGQVDTMPVDGERSTQLTFVVKQIWLSDGRLVDVKGKLLVQTWPGQGWQYGDSLSLKGSLISPPDVDGFSYQEFLARQGVFSMMNYPQIERAGPAGGNLLMKGIFRLRLAAWDVIRRSFPSEEGALLSGILLGLDDDLPTDLKQDFQDSGTAHIIAISGFNISVIAGLLTLLCGRLLRRRWAVLAAAGGIIFYTLLVGAGAAVVRAAIMGVMAMAGQWFGRRQNGENALAFTAACMCLINPLILWDASFQLSFAATLGLVLYADRMEEALLNWLERHFSPAWGEKVSSLLGELILSSLAAELTVLPVLAYHFQRLSIISLPANFFVLPVQPLLMILGGVATLGGLISPLLGQALAWLAWPLLAYTISMVKWLAAVPLASISIQSFPAVLIWGYYLLLFWLTENRSSGWQKKAWNGAMICAALGGMFFWRVALNQWQNQNQLVLFIYHSGGTAQPEVWIQTPGGQSLWVHDGGSISQTMAFLDGQLSPFERDVDVLVLPGSGPLSNSNDLLAQQPVQRVYLPTDGYSASSLLRLEAILSEKNIPFQILDAAQQMEDGFDSQVKLIPNSAGNLSVWVQRQGFIFLLPDGANPQELDEGLRGLAVLLLGPVDEESGTLDAWKDIPAEVHLWAGTDLPESLDSNLWQLLAPREWVRVSSDGVEMNLESAK